MMPSPLGRQQQGASVDAIASKQIRQSHACLANSSANMFQYALSSAIAAQDAGSAGRQNKPLRNVRTLSVQRVTGRPGLRKPAGSQSKARVDQRPSVRLRTWPAHRNFRNLCS